MTVHQLWLGLNVKEALDTMRLHHQLSPMVLYYEDDFDQVGKDTPSLLVYTTKLDKTVNVGKRNEHNFFSQDALDYLSSAGHVLSGDFGGSVCNVVSWSEEEAVEAAADGRKDGDVDGINEGEV